MPSTIELNQADPVVGQVADTAICIRAGDLRAGDQDKLAEAVRAACIETGFFYLDPTHAQRNAIDATLFQMDRFFSLEDSDARKQDVRQDERGYGWVPRGSEPAYQPGTVSRLEAFDFGLEHLQDTNGPCWPRLPDFRANLSACWREYAALGNDVLTLLSQAAGLMPEFFVSYCSSQKLNTMRLLHYAAKVPTRPDQDVGIAAHTDFEVVTLIYQTAPGLELLDANGNWLDAPASDGRIVVLIGDMIERWTNGTFKATGHRVRTTDEQRFSIVMFVAANYGCEIQPLPQFVTGDRPRGYEPITQDRHIDEEIKRAQVHAAAQNN